MYNCNKNSILSISYLHLHFCVDMVGTCYFGNDFFRNAATKMKLRNLLNNSTCCITLLYIYHVAVLKFID